MNMSSVPLRVCLSLLILLGSAGCLCAGDALSVGEFFLLELPISEKGPPPKTILRLHEGMLSFIAQGTETDDKGKTTARTMCESYKFDSDQDGVVTCSVGNVGKIILDRKAKTVILPMIEGVKPLVAQTPAQAAEQAGITWIMSKQSFKAKVRKGDNIMNYLLGPSIGLEDHFTIRLWDGTRIDVYAPDEKISAAYVEHGENYKGKAEWLIDSAE